jgi:hypothetical protein
VSSLVASLPASEVWSVEVVVPPSLLVPDAPAVPGALVHCPESSAASSP